MGIRLGGGSGLSAADRAQLDALPKPYSAAKTYNRGDTIAENEKIIPANQDGVTGTFSAANFGGVEPFFFKVDAALTEFVAFQFTATGMTEIAGVSIYDKDNNIMLGDIGDITVNALVVDVTLSENYPNVTIYAWGPKA